MSGIHISRDKAINYGMPHIGCKYTRDDVTATSFVPNEEGWTPCAVCGRPATNRHHLPPRSVSSCTDEKGRRKPGSLLLPTKYGKFVLKPALIALCGSGTTGCHGKVHNRDIEIQWEFDNEAYEQLWLDGWFLAHGIDGYVKTRDGMLTTRPIMPHSKQLYRIGRWLITANGRTWEYREL